MPSNSEAPKRTPAVQAFIRRFAAFQQRDEDEVVDPQALYRLEEDQLLLRVFEAKRLTKIGGGQIESDYNRVLKLEKAKRWAEAPTQLRVVGLNAQRVLLQQPWLEARRAHMADIEAGKKITRPESGPTWGARITELAVAAQDLADRQRFGAAAQKLIAASDLAKAAAQDPDLAHSRTSLAQQRETNVVAMNSIVGSGGELSPAQIDQLKICARWEFETLSKQAQNLGVDPSAPSREPIQDKKKCKQLFKDHDWFELKRMFHSNQVSKEDMWDLWRYRQDFVTRAFDTLRRTFPTLITKASGSVNLESDIDVTFASPGSGDDVKAAMAFNKHVIKVFGKPPGRTFDVNIYPRDYNPIKESFNTDYNLDPIVDRGIDEPTDDMHRLSRIDQDVATLLKQRRFLDGPTFKNLLDSILAAAPEDKRPKIRQRFEEGESIYLLTSLEKVDAIVHDLKKKKVPRSEYGDDLPSWLSRLQHLRKNKQKGSLESIKEMQNLLPAVLDLLEQTFEAHVMETTDRLYLERMADIREEQGRIRALSNEDADVDEHHPGQSCHEAHSGEEHADWRVAEDERTRAQVKKRQFETILFANEAYMSHGCHRAHRGRWAGEEGRSGKGTASARWADPIDIDAVLQRTARRLLQGHEGLRGPRLLDGRRPCEAARDRRSLRARLEVPGTTPRWCSDPVRPLQETGFSADVHAVEPGGQAAGGQRRRRAQGPQGKSGRPSLRAARLVHGAGVSQRRAWPGRGRGAVRGEHDLRPPDDDERLCDRVERKGALESGVPE